MIPMGVAGHVRGNRTETDEIMSMQTVTRDLNFDLKVSSQSRKFEFNVFSIIHLNMAITFDLLDRFQENKVFQTAQTMTNLFKVKYKCSFVPMETTIF